MVAALYTRLAKTARDLIAKYGKNCAIVRETTSGPPHAPVVTQTEYPVKIVETGYSLTNRNEVLVQAGDKVGIISTDAAVAPRLHDPIRIDGEMYRLIDLKPLNPGGLTLLFEFNARA